MSSSRLSGSWAAPLASAWHRLWIRPRTTLFTLVLLAVGVGLPTALFSLLDGVLLRGLPFPEGDRIVRVSTLEEIDWSISVGDFDALSETAESMERSGHPVLDGIAGGLSVNTVVTRPGIASKGMTGTYVTADLFSLLGVDPALGRDFTPGDFRPEAPHVVVISHRLWQRWFGGDPGALGEAVLVNREPMTIVGVMPAGFQFPVRQEVWTPLRREGWLTRAGVFAVGRLAPGVSPEEAERALAPVATRRDDEDPLRNGDKRRLTVVPYVRSLVPQEIDRSLHLMLWAVLGVLLIACGNVASLRLGDALARRRELAVRRALGARAGQLLRPLLAEAVALAAAGAAAGIGLAWLLVRGAGETALRGSMVERLFWVDVRLDGRACAFAVAAAVLAALLGTLPPALWSIARRELKPGSDVGSSTVGGPGATGGMRLASLLVVAQVAVCFVLVSASALLVASGRSLIARAPGFDPDGLLRVMVNPYQASWQGPEQPRAFWARLVPRLEVDPAIAGVTVASGVPWEPRRGEIGVGVATGGGTDDPLDQADGLPRAGMLEVRPGFFETLRLPILAGRGLEPRDVEVADAAATAGEETALSHDQAGDQPGDQSATPVEIPVLVSAGFARHQLGSRPLDATVKLFPRGDRPPIRGRVVGVAADRGVRTSDRAGTADTVYLPLSPAGGGGAFLIVRAARGVAAAGTAGAIEDVGDGADGGARDLLRRIDRAIAAVDPLVATLDPATYREDREETSWVERRLAELFSLFATTSLVLSGLGVFGVAVLSLRRRLRELAIRSALGARPVDLRLLLLRQGLTWIALGLAAGAGLGWLTHRLLRTVLHGVAPWDPTLLAASATLVILALLAAVAGPAHRAARTDPARALSAE